MAPFSYNNIMEFDQIKDEYEELLEELTELGEMWLEYKARGDDLSQIERAIAQATKDSRKLERKLRKLRKRDGVHGD